MLNPAASLTLSLAFSPAKFSRGVLEFDLIHRHFKTPFATLLQSNRKQVLAGIGDDCAALQLLPDHCLFTSTDTLVENVHFFSEDSPHTIGWKALACNLSDLAASGASPIGFLLNLSLPKVDATWLSGFSAGLLELASQFNCPLVGGDTTSAGSNTAKTISITVLGQAPVGHSGFNRSHAKAGDEIWISGTPGLARLGLLLEYQKRGSLASQCEINQLPHTGRVLAAMPEFLKERALTALQLPMPRIELGLNLHCLANACLDLSDGLSGDLAHVAKASHLAADLSYISLQAAWREIWPDIDQLPDSAHVMHTLVLQTLQGGDDFELCWTAQSSNHHAIQSIGTGLHCVGLLGQGDGVWLHGPGAQRVAVHNQSYNHFGKATS